MFENSYWLLRLLIEIPSGNKSSRKPCLCISLGKTSLPGCSSKSSWRGEYFVLSHLYRSLSWIAKHAGCCDHLATITFLVQCMCFWAAAGFWKVGRGCLIGMRYAFGFILCLEPNSCASRVILTTWQQAFQLLSLFISCPLHLGISIRFTTEF